MTKNELIESGLLEQYILGLTSDEESAEVERLSELYPEIKAQLTESKSGMKNYCKSHLRQQLFHKDKAAENQKVNLTAFKVRKNNIPVLIGLSLACLFFIITSLILFRQNRSASRDLALLQTHVDQLQHGFDDLRSTHQTIRDQIAVLKDIGTKQIYLHGLEFEPQTKAVVYWNGELKHALLNVTNLPPPPTNHQYQVWAETDVAHINLGLISLSRDVDFFRLPFLAKCNGFVITIEKSGGNETPSMDHILVSGEM